jgi:hypothetical protein
MGYRNYSTANGFIVDKLGNGDFKTIATALTAAVSGDTIFIRPGTYTENITLKAGVNLCAYEPSATLLAPNANIPNVIINGTCTFSTAGIVGISGISLQTNSAAALIVAGSAASVVFLDKCFINASNSTGITFSSSSASSLISINYCGGDIGTTGIALFAHSAAGNIGIAYSEFSNSGASVTASTCSGTGSFFPTYMYMESGITFSSSSTCIGNHCNFSMSANQTVITTSGTNTVTFEHTTFATNGAATAINIGATSTVALHYAFLSSSNASTISGTGTLEFTNLVFNSVASLAAGLTLTETSMHTFIGAGGVGTAGQVLTSNGASTPPTFQTGVGAIVQQVRASTSAEATLTTTIASITTLPTTANGTSVVSVSITPTNSAHILLIEGNVTCTSAGNNTAAWIIENATGNALATFWGYGASANQPMNIPIRFYQAAGTTSATTYAIYVATQSAGNTFINGNTSATQLSGGTAFTSIQVTEYVS